MSLQESITAPWEGPAPSGLVAESSSPTESPTSTSSFTFSPSSTASDVASSSSSTAPKHTQALLTPAQITGIAIGGVATAVVVFLVIAAIASCWRRRQIYSRSQIAEESGGNNGRFGPSDKEMADDKHQRSGSSEAVPHPEISAAYPKLLEPDDIGVAVSSENKTETTPISAESMQSTARLLPSFPPEVLKIEPRRVSDQPTGRISNTTRAQDPRQPDSGVGSTSRRTLSSSPAKPVNIFGRRVEPTSNSISKKGPLSLKIPQAGAATSKVSIPLLRRQRPNRDSTSTIIQEEPMSPAQFKQHEQNLALHMLRPPREVPSDYGDIPSYYYTQHQSSSSPRYNAAFNTSAPSAAPVGSRGFTCDESPTSTTTTLVNTTPPPQRPLRATPPPVPPPAHLGPVTPPPPQSAPTPAMAPPSAYRGTSGPPPRPVRSTPPPPPSTTNVNKPQKRPPSKVVTYIPQKANRDSASSFTSFETTYSDHSILYPEHPDLTNTKKQQHCLTPVSESATDSTLTSPISELRYPRIPRPTNQAVARPDPSLSKWHLEESPTRAGVAERVPAEMTSSQRCAPHDPKPQQQMSQIQPQPQKPFYDTAQNQKQNQLPRPPPNAHLHQRNRTSSSPAGISTSSRSSSTDTLTLASKRKGSDAASALQNRLWITQSNGRTASPTPLDAGAVGETAAVADAALPTDSKTAYPTRTSSRKRVGTRDQSQGGTVQHAAAGRSVDLPSIQIRSPIWTPRLTPRRSPGGDLLIDVS